MYKQRKQIAKEGQKYDNNKIIKRFQMKQERRKNNRKKNRIKNDY